MSTNNNVAAQVEQLVAPIVAQAGLYLEGVAFRRAGKYSTLTVTVDIAAGPGAVDSQQLEDLSREISAALDAADPISGAYTLEVSTPGAERRLETERHYSRAIGYLAQFVLRDGTALTARVTALEPGRGITVTTYGEKNKQLVATGMRELEFAQIAKARMVAEL